MSIKMRSASRALKYTPRKGVHFAYYGINKKI